MKVYVLTVEGNTDYMDHFDTSPDADWTRSYRIAEQDLED